MFLCKKYRLCSCTRAAHIQRYGYELRWLDEYGVQFSMYNGDKSAFQTNPYLNLYNPYNVQNGLAGVNGYPFIYAGNRGNRGPQYNQLSQYGSPFPSCTARSASTATPSTAHKIPYNRGLYSDIQPPELNLAFFSRLEKVFSPLIWSKMRTLDPGQLRRMLFFGEPCNHRWREGLTFFLRRKSTPSICGERRKNTQQHCLIPSCQVTLCIHSETTPVGQFSENVQNQSINQAQIFIVNPYDHFDLISLLDSYRLIYFYGAGLR